jgi:two-component system sensor histidine kinase AgrC
LVDGLRTFKHDYNNTLATLYGYVQLNDTKSLKRMFKEILEESKQISSLDKLNPNLIKDPNIFGILIAKYQECIKRNIAMEFEIFAELENLEIKTYDLTRIIGIFLDNAIEAAGGSTEKKINLLINEDKATVTIEISNTYSNKEISIEHMFEKGVSSKGENRGLGLYKVKEILKRCTGAELKTTNDDNVFLQKLIIQKSKNISVANQ